MSDNTGKDKSRPDWKGVVELVKDGIGFAEKIVGGRNALIAGTVGLTLGVGLGAMMTKPDAKDCAEYMVKEQSDRSREALRKFLEAPVRGGF